MNIDEVLQKKKSRFLIGRALALHRKPLRSLCVLSPMLTEER